MKNIPAKLIFIPLVSLAALPALSMADVPAPGSQEFSIAGAGSSDKDFDNNAFALDASFGNYLSSNAAFGVRQSVTVIDSEANSAEWNGATRLFYDYHFGQQNMRPFVGAHIGYIYGDSVEETFIAGPELGLKYYVLPATFIVGQIEYQFLFEDADDADDRFDDGAFAHSIGIGFNF